MLSTSMSLLGIVTCFVVWLIFTILIMIQINYGPSAKAKKKIVEEYEYFNYPIYKKFFLAGLRGIVPIVVIIITWIINILLLCLFVAFLWNILNTNIVASYCLRVGGFILLILNIIRLFIMYNLEIKF